MKRYKLFISLVCIALCVGLTGCAVPVPLMFTSESGVAFYDTRELQAFTAIDPEKRVMNSFVIEWVTRADASEYCQRLYGSANNSYLGCAKWDAFNKRCVIITQRTTTHAILGHELRHCFEGQFHG
jgi:hypothetical protein